MREIMSRSTFSSWAAELSASARQTSSRRAANRFNIFAELLYWWELIRQKSVTGWSTTVKREPISVEIRSCRVTAHRLHQAHCKTGKGCKNGHRSGGLVGESHVRVRVGEASHDKKNEGEKCHGKKEADNARDQTNRGADKEFAHEDLFT